MDEQRFRIDGMTYGSHDPAFQGALARVHGTEARPRCLCSGAGIDMYVARHGRYVVKRMPGTGSEHDPACPSYEPEYGQSGLGELVGQSIIEHSPDAVELRVGFALSRLPTRTLARTPPREPVDVGTTAHRMSLRAVMHFLFERAGFNRWTPAMEGKRTQAVLRRYLMDAAEGVMTKGVPLRERLYVPETFREELKREIAQRRRERLAFLHTADDVWHFKMALVIGEYKAVEPAALGYKLHLRHLPDAALFVEPKTWQRLQRAYAALFEARDADTGTRPRIVMCALIYAKREHVYQIDSASLMLASENWIPLEGIHEADLVHELTLQRRRFIKPLRYDAASAAPFPNAILLDGPSGPVPLHLVSPLMDARERAAKERVVRALGASAWVWHTSERMPPLPHSPIARASSKASRSPDPIASG